MSPLSPTRRQTLGTRQAGFASEPERGEDGYLLIALVVAMFLLALFLTIAAPTVARSLERDREVESEHRAQQYVRAIHNYYAKFKTYPASVDVLLNQNNQHFLRQQYKDPLTGGDYRLIHFGEAKTTVKGFFGEELEGFAQGSLGAMAGSASGIGTGLGGAQNSSGGIGSRSGGFGSSTPSTFGNSFGSGSGSGAGSSFSSGSSSMGSSTNSSSSSSSGTLGGTSATQFQGSKGAIVGVGSNKTGHGIVEWNGSSNIEDWEFLYDPRVDLLKARVSIFGGSPGESGNGSLGSLGGSTSGLGSNTPSFGPGSGTGSFGSGSGSGFGSGTGSPSGNSGSGSSFGNSFGNQPR